jgi:hypothetical protein
MIKRHSGEPNIQPYKKVASVAFAFNDVVAKNSSGFLVKATATTPRSEIIGLIQREVLSTDADYADNTMVPVDVIKEEDEVVADVGTGTAVQSMVGKRFDLKDENELDVSVELTKVFKITRILSTTKVVGSFRRDGERIRLVTYVQNVALADFTDGGAAVGTIALGCSIPVGAVYHQSFVKVVTGAAGASTATITIGDGSDVDRYNTGTPSVATTAANGIDIGIPSGTLYHAAAITPVVTVTEDSEWGDITALSLTIGLSWYELD